MADLIEIPSSLLEAKSALDAAIAVELAITRASASAGGAARAATRVPELDREIERLHGLMLADDALAAVPGAGDARMTAEERLTAEGDLNALREQRESLAQKSQAGEAVAGALRGRIAEKSAATLAARRVLAQEMRRFLAAIEPEFVHDVGRLTLPDLFKKWSAISAGVHYSRITTWLDEMSISGPGAWGTLLQGKFYASAASDPVDWRGTWREDPPLLAVHRQLAEIAQSCGGSPYILEAEIQRQEHARASAAIDAEILRRRSDNRPRPAVVNYERVAPTMTRLESEPRTPPPPVGPYD